MSIPARAFLTLDGLSSGSTGSVTLLRSVPGFSAYCAQWASVSISGLSITLTRPASGSCTIVLAIVPGDQAVEVVSGKVDATSVAARLLACEVVHFAKEDTTTSTAAVSLSFPPRIAQDLNVAQVGEWPPALLIFAEGGSGSIKLFLRADLTGSGVGYTLPY